MRWIFCTLFFLCSAIGAIQETEKKPEEKKIEQKGPSLVDLAKKSRQQSEQNKQSLVITNADLRFLKNSKVGTSQNPSRGTKVEAEGGEDKTIEESESNTLDPESNEPNTDTDIDLAKWTAAFNQATMDIKTAVNARMVIELRLNHLQNAYYRETDGARRGFWEQEIVKATTEIHQAKETEQTANSALRDLQKEALKEGLLPGQIRKLTGQLPEAKSIVDVPVPKQKRDD